MYQVSEQYKEQIEKPLRNPSWILVKFNVVEPDALYTSTLSDNGHLFYSEVEDTDQPKNEITQRYATLEQNTLILDGGAILPSLFDYQKEGFVSDNTSDENGIFVDRPTVKIAFGNYFNLAGLTLTFDKIFGDYPSEVEITYYKDKEVISKKKYSIDNYTQGLEEHIMQTNAVEIAYTESVAPFRRARLDSILYGLIENLDNEKIVDCTLTQETDSVSSELPNETFNFNIFDVTRRYDPENPDGIWDFMKSGQPVEFNLGYELDDGSIEWQLCSTTITTGEMSVNRTGVATEINVGTNNLLGRLTRNYDEMVYIPNGITLEELARNVLLFSGYGEENMILDSSLANIKTSVILEPTPCNQILQIIANASGCVIGSNRKGQIVFSKWSDNDPVFDMDFAKMTDTPTITKIPVLRNFVTEYQQVSIGTDTTTLVNEAEVQNANHTEIEFSHSAGTSHNVAVDGTLVVHNKKFYANKTVLELTGTGKVTITGKEIVSTPTKYTLKCNYVGEDLEISNPIISDFNTAEKYAEWVSKELLKRTSYESTDRGYPEIDVSDDVRITTNNGNTMIAKAVARTTTFKGGISGSGKYLVREE